jgi:hypothetical protein
VQLTAAAFTKGFLQLEGNLTPILVNLCRKDAGLLDDVSDASRDLDSVKVRLRKILSRDEDLRVSIRCLTALAGVTTGGAGPSRNGCPHVRRISC